MGGAEEEVAVLLERGLGAVAVVDVEVDHGDAGQPVGAPRPLGPDHDIVEEAEPHRPAGLGMVARRAHRAEGVIRLAGEDRVHRRRHRARSPPRRLARGRRHHRVGVDGDASFIGHVGENGVHQLMVVRPGEDLGLAHRGRAALERRECIGGERILDRPQARARPPGAARRGRAPRTRDG